MISVHLPTQLPLFTLHHHILLPGSTMRVPVNNPNNASLLETLLEGRVSKTSIIGVVVVEGAHEKGIQSTEHNMQQVTEVNNNKTSSQIHTDNQESKHTSIQTDKERLHSIGTAALVVEYVKSDWLNDGPLVLLTGLCRFEVKEVTRTEPFYMANVLQLDRIDGKSGGDMASDAPHHLASNFREQTKRLIELLQIPSDNLLKLRIILDKIPIAQLTDVCVAIIRASFQERLSILDAVDSGLRLQKAMPLLQRQIEEVKMASPKQDQASKVNNKPALRLRRGRTNEDDEEDDEIASLEDKIKIAGMPGEVERVVWREMRRMKKMSSFSPEAAIIRNHVELMVELPWNTSTKDTIDIIKARDNLDAEHHGMKKVKERLVEFLAVQKVKNNNNNNNKYINNNNNDTNNNNNNNNDNNNINNKENNKNNMENNNEVNSNNKKNECGVTKAPLLCLVGPPGVGKTSIARSVADTLGRKFCRISLGGISDQSDIRGHRRTYIGSMPGRIIQALKRSHVNNPVILLDEIDKMSRGVHGDPAAALLEVLDPEQNHAFVDHFVNVPFDLSQVLFIATANSLSGVQAALRDRMEVVEIPGYTIYEKVHIASKHLLPRQALRHGIIINTHVVISDHVIEFIISRYTREAGVRGLERKLAGILRAVALKVAENGADGGNDNEKDMMISDDDKKGVLISNNDNKKGMGISRDDKIYINNGINGDYNYMISGDHNNDDGKQGGHTNGGNKGNDDFEFNKSITGVSSALEYAHTDSSDDTSSVGGAEVKSACRFPIVMSEKRVEEILGPAQHLSDTKDRLSTAGVAVGLAWTAYGGEVLYVEARKMRGKGRLVMTGQLGEVMKESASLALAWLNTHAAQLGINSYDPASTDFHIHFPAAAISKDGPSAGITIATALVSLVTNRKVRSDTAMTGELTLTGVVLPVGGVKEKVLAAHRDNIHRVILPLNSQHQLEDIPPNILSKMEVILVKRVEEVLVEALTTTTTMTTPTLACKL